MNMRKVAAAKAVLLDRSETSRSIGVSLKKLRKLAGVTQKEMAQRLNVGQAAISKIEKCGDVYVNSIERYVAALGATVRIEEVFSPSQDAPNKHNIFFSPDNSDDKQIALPLFEDGPHSKQRDVILSIHPYYTEKIMGGQKTVELRRRFPKSALKGTVAYIYSTSPERALVGKAEISDVLKLPIKQIWQQFNKNAFIERTDFDAYFDGLDEGFALQFIKAEPFPRPLTLAELRKRFGFEPPQSFLYVTPDLRKALRDEFPSVSN